jgi:transposase
MRKIKEVLRLHSSSGLTQRQIARSCSIGQSTVSDYLKAAEAAGLGGRRCRRSGTSGLAEALLRAAPGRAGALLPAPDFAAIHAELQQHKHLTLQLVWEEYRAAAGRLPLQPFCELYQRWRRKLEVVLRQEHRAGEKLFVDYAGRTIPVQDPATGERARPRLFVAVSAPATTPSPKPPGRKGWPTGSARTSGPSSFSAACRRSWCRTI